jgi:tetratricopeptide (TPR) repeat protein
LVREAKAATDDSQRLVLLERALALWRGRALADVAPDCRDEAAIATLERERVDAGRAAGLAALAVEAPGRAVDLIEGLAAADPLNEGLQAVLMEALAATGRQAAAFSLYERVKSRLAEELGVDPGEQLRAAHLRVVRQQLPPRSEIRRADREEASPQPPGPAQPVSMTAPCLVPPDAADFTGREQPVQELIQLLTQRPAGTGRAPALASIFGRPGVGKTTLAVHVAHQIREAFPDGQLYVNLGGAESTPPTSGEVLGRFLRALGTPDALVPVDPAERQALYRNQLGGRRVLILLDNAADEAQVEPLVPGTATCGVLTTSRRRLAALPGALCVELDGLEVDSAVEMLAAVAGSARVAGEPNRARQLISLCGYLPLAIRIVGARLAARPDWRLEQLADLLSDERHRLDELSYRHLEVRASITLSYRAIGAHAGRLLRMLGVLDAPEVAGWVAAPLLGVSTRQAEHELGTLVEAQLVDYVGVDSTGQARFRMHDLVRLYARERASEDPVAEGVEALRRQFTMLLQLLRGAARDTSGFLGPPLDAATQRLDPAVERRLLADPFTWFDVERITITSAIRQTGEIGLDTLCWQLAINASGLFAVRNRRDEATDCLNLALAAAQRGQDRQGEAYVLTELASPGRWHGQPDADAMLARALSLFNEVGDSRGRATVLLCLAFFSGQRGDQKEAARRYEEALLANREEPDSSLEYEARRGLGRIHHDRGDNLVARQHVSQAVAAARGAGHNFALGMNLAFLAAIDVELGQFDQAESELDEALRLVRASGPLAGLTTVLRTTGLLRVRQGRLDEAASLAEVALTYADELADNRLIARAYALAARVHYHRGNPDQATADLEQAITRHRRDRGLPDLADALVLRGDIARDRQPAIAKISWTEALEIYNRIGSRNAQQAMDRLTNLNVSHPQRLTPGLGRVAVTSPGQTSPSPPFTGRGQGRAAPIGADRRVCECRLIDLILAVALGSGPAPRRRAWSQVTTDARLAA